MLLEAVVFGRARSNHWLYCSCRCVAKERKSTVGHVAVTRVVIERKVTVGYIEIACYVAIECVKTHRGIIDASRETEKRAITHSSVITGITSARCRETPLAPPAKTQSRRVASVMRVKPEVERGKGLVSTFVRGPLIEIWIGVFISIIAFYWVVPFG